MAEDDESKPEGKREPKPDSNLFRSVGERLGGWARRATNLVADVSGRPTIPEPLLAPLQQARTLRIGGDPASALGLLREVRDGEHGKNPLVSFAVGLTLVHDLLAGGRPIKALQETVDALGDGLGPGPQQLLRAAAASFEGRQDAALDDLRRAGSGFAKLPAPDEREARFLLHVLSGLAHLRLGNEERGLRELRKARVRMPPEAEFGLRALVLRKGVELALAAGEIADAEAWVREAIAAEPERALPKELLCRTLAAKGDRVAAHAMLEELGEDPSYDETRVFVGLTVGLPDDDGQGVRALALRRLQADPEDLEARRGWALTEVELVRRHDSRMTADLKRQVLDALRDASAAAPKATRDRYLQELAHVALRLEALDERTVAPVLERLGKDVGTAPEELRLLRARHRLSRKDEAHEDFVPGVPVRFRTDPDVGASRGPDPRSPVRNPDLRFTVLSAQRSLAAAEYALQRQELEAAQDLLVEALVEDSNLQRAKVLLAELAHPDAGARLEDLLASATTLLAGVPNRVLGVPLEGVQAAMGRVVAARERLARPLTIAIMGEFSAGKSTFVNALLGEAVAPMGVLPTTTTINVFRHGAGGGARVHYRDGRIAIVAPDDVQTFLHGLDDTAASRIRHVEIERKGARMGDAAVVDTPGLNALDAYHEQVARGFLDEADAVVWVFSATRSGAASEVGMLSELRAGGRQVLGVLNKVDTLEPAEQDELAKYLRDQLGEVLVEVVPLSGRKALEYRTGQRGPDERDPFGPVERALETHFLQRARELKRSLTLRRLGEALTEARAATLEGIAKLELLAAEASARTHRGRGSVEHLLHRFCDSVRTGLLDASDVLTREGLGIGVLQTKKGLAKGPLDPLDAEYLSASFRDAAVAALQRALAEVAGEDVDASAVLAEVYVPWARGNIEGLVAAQFIGNLVKEHGPAVVDGESAVTAAFRQALQPVAEAWVSYGIGLVHAVEHARHRAERRSSSAPRAEALRLRSVVLTAIDTLRSATEQVPA